MDKATAHVCLAILLFLHVFGLLGTIFIHDRRAIRTSNDETASDELHDDVIQALELRDFRDCDTCMEDRQDG